jgi:hypothetical protein
MISPTNRRTWIDLKGTSESSKNNAYHNDQTMNSSYVTSMEKSVLGNGTGFKNSNIKISGNRDDIAICMCMPVIFRYSEILETFLTVQKLLLF